MKKNTQILPGVKSIGWIDCNKIFDDVVMYGICKKAVPILTDIHPIEFFGEPKCERVTKSDNHGRVDTASLSFATSAELPTGINLGFIVTDVNNNSYLIGSKEHPHARAEITERLGAASGDNACVLYEVTHIALRSMIKCWI